MQYEIKVLPITFCELPRHVAFSIHLNAIPVEGYQLVKL